ncbi:GNAT family N-acetyltransferase [Francisella philomiragia]|uniref:GNAT family N-acetyltransferase n=1 Tax=Francisella philomiragia TaxID=28110 RepID=UPI0035168F1A
MLELVDYDEQFLSISWKWLNDVEIKRLTMTPVFTEQDQTRFFKSIKKRKDYKIFGIVFNNSRIGACGLKNIRCYRAEYWGYIGEKEYWGRGLGKEMMMKILDVANKEGIKSIYLKVHKDNYRAISLYKKLSFVEDVSQSTSDVIQMELELL